MDRRNFLMVGGALTMSTAFPGRALAEEPFAPRPGAWRRFEIVTRLKLTSGDAAQAWVPLPSVSEDGWIRPLGNTWSSNAASIKVEQEPRYGTEMLHLTWSTPDASPKAEITNRFEIQDRAVDLANPQQAAPLTPAERELYTAATVLIPTDGLVRETATRIAAGAASDLDKARAIYNWVVENTVRKASVRGCGSGNVAAMLATGDLGGKCADINALFVGLARSVGLPARDVYGIRVAPSRFGYRSLGANSETITKAQHCRAEVHLTGFGWVPVDPADVRKVVLEEPPGNRALSDAKVVDARAALFGAWEGNWLAYNVGHDVALPGSKEAANGFLMYPEAEVAGWRLDCLDPDRFAYTITAREISAT